MKSSFLFLLTFLVFSDLYTKQQQMIMFVHTQPGVLNDEEGLNITYQLLTALEQKAAPVLASEKLWQHVISRRERFMAALKDRDSVQSMTVKLFNETNQFLADKNGDTGIINNSLNNAWFSENFKLFSTLSENKMKHLQFDFFCYTALNDISGYDLYRLDEGYLLWIPKEKGYGFCLDKMRKVSDYNRLHEDFKRRSLDLDVVMKKYICLDSELSWAFYLTGHGYNKDKEHEEDSAAGLSLDALRKFLLSCDRNKGFKTDLLLYGSCYGAGRNSILPYQKNMNDLLLSFPVILISLTNAPTYVFGYPSSYKLPPYNSSYFLNAWDIVEGKLSRTFMQRFDQFVAYAKSKKVGKDLAYSVNQYVRDLGRVQIENIPLVRYPRKSYFEPLDKRFISCLMEGENTPFKVQNKSALLFYVKEFSGTIEILERLPVFISMIPGTAAVSVEKVIAEKIDFIELVRSLFMKIDDILYQKIYLFRQLQCSISLDHVGKVQNASLKKIIFIPSGSWLPVFANKKMAAHLYFEYGKKSFLVEFNDNQMVQIIRELNQKERKVISGFRDLLLADTKGGRNKTAQEFLSINGLMESRRIKEKLFDDCVRRLICQ